MNNIDWSKAPKWADRVVVGPLSGAEYWANGAQRMGLGRATIFRNNAHIDEHWTVLGQKPSHLQELLSEISCPSRDDLAMAAMQAMLTRHPSDSAKVTAMQAYALADAMLAERAK